MKPAERIKQEISHVEQATTDELRRELEALIGTSDVTKVTGLIN